MDRQQIRSAALELRTQTDEIIAEAKRTHARMVSAGCGDEADRGLLAVIFLADPGFRERVESVTWEKAAVLKA